MAFFIEDTDLAVMFKTTVLVDFERSSKAKIELWKHPLLGLILTINGEVQHVEKWQPLYHEPLVHLAAAFVPNVSNVLILGGGSLFAAAQSLLYPTINSVTLVDHDPMVLTLIERHYEHAQKVHADNRFSFVQSDIVDYLENSTECFDLVINDGFDLVHPPRANKIHQLMNARQVNGGACVDVTYRHLFDADHLAETLRVLGQLGPHVFSLVTVPEYPGTLHLLNVWGNRDISQTISGPINIIQRKWMESFLPSEIVYFNPRYLNYYLYLPPYVKNIIKPSSNEGAFKTKIG